ncbi:MAG: hypothetical protein DRZ76_02605, partial [Candidatus Nealsonbacteria bacterium]
MAVNLNVLNRAREIEKQLQSPSYLQERARQEKIRQYQAETEQLRQKAKELETPTGLAKETLSGIWGGVKSIGGYIKRGLEHPKEIPAGIFEEAVLKPAVGLTRLAAYGGKSKLSKEIVEKMEAGLKEYEEQFAPHKEARTIGEFIGWMIPYSATERAIGKIPAITKLGKLTPVVKELGAWVSTNQLLYDPKTDSSRAKQALEDLAAFGVLKGAGKLFKLAKGKFAVRIADEAIKPVENAMKRGEKVPLEEVEKAVNKAKKIIKAGTGKEPKQVVKEEIVPKLAPEIKTEVKKPVPEAISKEKSIKPLSKVKKPAEAKIERIPKELEPLAKEAIKYKSAKEFERNLEQSILNIIHKEFPYKEPVRGEQKFGEIAVKSAYGVRYLEGFYKYLKATGQSMEDFYNQATKGIKEIKKLGGISDTRVPKGISEIAFRWLDAEQGSPEKAYKLLTPEIEKELSKFKPQKPVRLYRAQKIGSMRKGFTSWTHNRELAEAIAEHQKGYNVISKIIKPEDILVDLTKVPEGNEHFLDEVIVKTMEGVKGVKPVIKPKIKPKRIKVPSEQLPVGKGKEVASRLEKRIVKRLSKVPERYKTVMYRQMNKAEQIKKAVDYVVKNESEAMEVLMGKKEPPKGLLHNSVFLAMEEKAKQ